MVICKLFLRRPMMSICHFITAFMFSVWFSSGAAAQSAEEALNLMRSGNETGGVCMMAELASSGDATAQAFDQAFRDDSNGKSIATACREMEDWDATCDWGEEGSEDDPGWLSGLRFGVQQQQQPHQQQP